MTNPARITQTTIGGLPGKIIFILAIGSVVAMVGFGVRASFGLFLSPMTEAHGWNRELFSLALALQNLCWGIAMPFAGALADRFGAPKVLVFGALLFAAGVVGMAVVQTGIYFILFAGLITGMGIAFTSFSLVMAAMAKLVGPERRSFALGLGTAAGSLGMVVFSPLGQTFITLYGWHTALYLLAGCLLAMIPLMFFLPSGTKAVGEPAFDQTLTEALHEAMKHRGYILLSAGFFVCGFHVAFISVHFPAYIRDLGMDGSVAAIALALIGFCNIIGSFSAGLFGQRFSKKIGLSSIYFTRAIVITCLLVAPKTELTIYAFAVCMGLLWLATVPLTTGIVAQIFGARYLATLFGIVFLSHQLGSFLGIWLGGYLYDTIGSYDPVWWAGVAFGLLAAFMHLPINERPLARLAGATG